MATPKIPSVKSRTPPEVPRFGEIAAQLVANGYPVVPLHFGQKRPTPNDWTNYEFDPKHVRGTLSLHRLDGTGILTGGAVAIDIDVRDAGIVAELEELADKILGSAPRRIGAAPKVLRLYRTATPFAKILSNSIQLDDEPGAKPHRIEVLGVGQQFVAFNQHPATGKPYQWNGVGDPLTVPFGDLVEVTETQVRGYVAKANEILARHAKQTNDELPEDLRADLEHDAEEQAARVRGDDKLEARDPEETRDALASIPNDDLDYDAWVKVGHAVAGALGADGNDAWHDWSAMSGKYDEAETEKVWAGFMKAGAEGKLRSGAGTIIKLARDAGWIPKASAQRGAGDDITIESLSDEWLDEEPPAQEWSWEHRTPLGSVTGVVAEGGVGKTWFGLRMTEASALGSSHFLTPSHDPRSLRKGTAVFVNAEDPPAVVRRRLWAIRQRKFATLAKTYKGAELGKRVANYRSALKERFRLINLVGKSFSLVQATNNQVTWGPGLDKLLAMLRTVDDLVLVVLDPLARLHTGDENSNTVSTMLINAAERIAQEFNCAVLILHHVSKDAANKGNVSAHAGRGGSAFGDGARSVLRLITAKPDDVRGLRLMKTDLNLVREVPVEPRDIADGNVIIIHHAKSSYGPRQRDLFLLRDRDTGELLPLKVVTDERDPYGEQLDRLADWLAQNPMAITKGTFREATELRKRVFGVLSKKAWLELFETAVTKGDLVVDPTFTSDNPEAIGYRLADTRHTRQTPASGSAGVPVEGAGVAVAGTPAASPDVLGGGCPSGGSPEAVKAPRKGRK